MYLNFRGISRVIAAFLIVQGVAMIPSALMAVFYKEINMLIIFSCILFFEILVGFMMIKIIKPSPIPFRIRDGFIIVSSCWIIAGLMGAIPFWFSGFFDSIASAIFESFSGFTTTGASVLTNIEILPKSVLFWRCFTHWIGGFGIVFVPIALLPALGFEGQVIARAELSGLSLNKLTPRLSDTARRLFVIFFTLTFAETILLMLGGMSFFDAITHAFSTMGTGGFSNYNSSVGHFDSNYIYWIISIFMLLAGINFNLYYMALIHGIKDMIKDAELKFYLIVIVGTLSLITIFLCITDTTKGFFDSLTHSTFQTLSILTTTGFCTLDYDNLWPLFPKMLLLALMFIGGCSSSTAGGIKCIRILVLLKMIKRGIQIRLHPNAIIDIKANKRRLSIDSLQATSSFIFLYFSLIVIGTIVVSLSGFDAVTSFSAVIASVGNVGPGFGLVGPVMNYSIFSDPIKLFLSLLMLFGRLELMTIVVLFSPKFWNPNH